MTLFSLPFSFQWQYVAGVGNDPRTSRQFNSIKQGKDYDKEGECASKYLIASETLKLPLQQSTLKLGCLLFSRLMLAKLIILGPVVREVQKDILLTPSRSIPRGRAIIILVLQEKVECVVEAAEEAVEVVKGEAGAEEVITTTTIDGENVLNSINLLGNLIAVLTVNGAIRVDAH